MDLNVREVRNFFSLNLGLLSLFFGLAAAAQIDQTGAQVDAAELLIRTKRHSPEFARLLLQTAGKYRAALSLASEFLPAHGALDRVNR